MTSTETRESLMELESVMLCDNTEVKIPVDRCQVIRSDSDFEINQDQSSLNMTSSLDQLTQGYNTSCESQIYY